MAEGLITDRRLEESTAKALTFAPVEIAKEQSPGERASVVVLICAAVCLRYGTSKKIFSQS